MPYLLFSVLLMSCSQKYQTYHVIDKYNFDVEKPNTPITKKLYPGNKTTLSYCKGQFFFYNNAKKETDQYLPHMLRGMCRKSNYILNSKLTETWWTTIIYSRSCIKMEGYCPALRK